MPELGVNIDHVATVREARKTYEPDPVWAAVAAELGGADGITIHLREDRRHIHDRDLRLLRETVTVKLNLELAAAADVVAIACEVRPDQATLVPERREEVTTEGGLDVVTHRSAVAEAVKRLHDAGIAVSLFLDPDERQTRDGGGTGCGSRRIAHRPVRPGAGHPSGRGVEQAGHRRAADLSRGDGAARRARPELPQCQAGGRDWRTCTN